MRNELMMIYHMWTNGILELNKNGIVCILLTHKLTSLEDHVWENGLAISIEHVGLVVDCIRKACGNLTKVSTFHCFPIILDSKIYYKIL